MKRPAVTVDGIILFDDKIVLIKRRKEPFRGFWALPGGFIEYGEKAEEAVIREVKEETGLDVKIEKLVGVYSDPRRDPRGHTVSICYLCKVVGGELRASSDAAEVRIFDLKDLSSLKLAFDHAQMLKDAGLLKV